MVGGVYGGYLCSPNSAYSPRAAKQRRKEDRLVIACQEQTYWLVNRPPVSPLCGEGVVSWTAAGPSGSQCVFLKHGAMGRMCLLGSWWVTGGSNSVAHQNLEIMRPGLRLPTIPIDHRRPQEKQLLSGSKGEVRGKHVVGY